MALIIGKSRVEKTELACEKAVNGRPDRRSPAAGGPIIGTASMTTQPGMIRLAVIDTDSSFLTVLGNRLDATGWEYRVLPGGAPLDEIVAMKLNALLVDPAALGGRGWEFLEQVCGAVPGLGVLVCTAQSTVSQRVRGLRLGADDWITKPSHPEEVLARVEAVVRRRKRAAVKTEVGPLVAGELEIRADQYQAFISGESVGLTRREFELLQALAEAEGTVVEREQLYERVWGYAMAHGDRSVDVFIRKLRQKLRNRSATWRYIHTHFGVGYRFEPESEDGEKAVSGSSAADLETAEDEAADEAFTTASP
jgi:DNA-binding response OmpR family regulator